MIWLTVKFKVLNNRQQLNHPYHHAVQLNCVIMLRVNLIGGVSMVFTIPAEEQQLIRAILAEKAEERCIAHALSEADNRKEA